MTKTDDNALVSVIIPAYNPGPLIVDAIGSVLAQTIDRLEIIVVDDASTDDVESLLSPFGDRVRYVRQDHGGPSVARNRGILVSRAPFVAFLDADDLWMPEKIEKQLSLIEDAEDVVLVYNDFYKGISPDVDRTSALKIRQHWIAGKEFQGLLRQNFIHTSSVLVRREALADAGIFDTIMTSGEDLDLWIRLASVGRCAFVDEILTYYRVHDQQTVRTLEYARSLTHTNKIVLARWSHDMDSLKFVRPKAGMDLVKLGRAELRAGNFVQARKAFWEAAVMGPQHLRSLGKALYCAIVGPPAGVIRALVGRGR